MVGLEYAAFQKRFKEEVFLKNARQAAKPGNFGYPGGMGAVKMVHQQRKQGPNTPHPSGPSQVEDENGDLVPGYKGLRFCILMNNAKYCGGDKRVIDWRGRRITPTCRECIECAQRLKDSWLRQWPENKPYFDHVQDCMENGQVITERMLARWPHLREWFSAGTRLAPGQIMHHVSGRIRMVDEEGFCSLANGYFQGLLGDVAKSWVRRIARECYDRTYRVPHQKHHNSHTSAYGGAQSPLYGQHLVAFLHDEVLPELREDVAHDAATRISEIGCEELRYYCPDVADAVKAPPCLMKRWDKRASPLYEGGRETPANNNDHLVIWAPPHVPT